MIILRVPTLTHFSVRALEWGLSFMLLSIGLCLFDPFPTLDQVAFEPIRQIGDDVFWGTVMVVIAVIRLTALWRNGGWVPSPWIRMSTSAISACVWGLFALGLKEAFVLLPIFIGFTLADIYSVGRASTDARLSHDDRMKKPEAPKIMPVPIG